jgi:hypothetical protein
MCLIALSFSEQSAPKLNEDWDIHLAGAFGADGTALEELIEQVS